jgi:membrane protein DedA with SNARE-associated domain
VSIGQLVSGVVASAGYPAVFGLVGLESLGIPLPGETALIVASIDAGTTHRLSPWIIFAVAAAGAIAGDNAGFLIGIKGGYRLARRHGPRVRLDERKLKAARYLADRHGAKLVFFGRFIFILRAYAAFLAGTSRMRWPRFVVANAAGGIVWAAAYTSAGYLAGTALQRLSLAIDLVLGGVACLVIAVVVVLLRRRMGDLTERAERAYPDPLD